jgi:hypothetical protein
LRVADVELIVEAVFGQITRWHAANGSSWLRAMDERTAVVKWFAFVILPIVVVVLTGVATWLALIWLSAAGMLRALAQLALGRL